MHVKSSAPGSTVCVVMSSGTALPDDFLQRMNAARAWASRPASSRSVSYTELAGRLGFDDRKQFEASVVKRRDDLVAPRLREIADALDVSVGFLRGETNEISPRPAGSRGDIDLAREALQQIEAARQTILRFQTVPRP